MSNNPSAPRPDLPEKVSFQFTGKAPDPEIIRGLDMKHIYNAMVDGEDKLATLDEKIFVYVYLPLFVEGKSAYRVDMQDWISLAGAPNKEVTIVNERGEALYNVPGVYVTGSVKQQNVRMHNRRLSLGDAVEQAKGMSRVHPKQGIAFLNTVLPNFIRVDRDLTDVVKNLLRWNTIYTRYRCPNVIDPAIIKQCYDFLAEHDRDSTLSGEGSTATSIPPEDLFDDSAPDLL